MEGMTFVIAEASTCWRVKGKEMDVFSDMANLAAKCGANAIKVQYVSDPRAMEQRRNVAIGSYERLAWPQAWLGEMGSISDSLGLDFLCTCFLPIDVDIVAPFVKRFKIASLEYQDHSIWVAMRKYGKQIIASTGACSAVEVQTMGKWLSPGDKLLACTVSYPCDLKSVNLSALRGGFNGYSDHSRNIITGAIAVACGAEIIEVHFRLEDTLADDPDFEHSLDPEQLEEYISNIRQAELMLGDGVKKIMPCEEWALKHKVKA